MKIRTKLNLFILGLLLALGTVLSVVLSVLSYQMLEEHTIIALGEVTRLKSHDLLSEVEDIRQQMVFLSRLDALQGIYRARMNAGIDPVCKASERVWKERLGNTFIDVLNTQQNYFQLRFIGLQDGGREIVRVMRRQGKPVVVADSELQTQGTLRYFQLASELAPGQVFLSNLTLEHDATQTDGAALPTLLAASPLFDSQGEFIGVIVAKVNVRSMLARLATGGVDGQSVYLTNTEGDFLLHPDARLTFGFERGERHRLQDLFDDPRLTAFMHDESLARTHFIVSQPHASRNILYLSKLHFDPERPYRYWVLALVAPYNLVVADAVMARNWIFMLVLSFALLSSLLTVLLAQVFTRPLAQMARAAEALGAGEYALDLPCSRDDEFGTLAQAFQNMAARIENDTALLRASEAHMQAIVENSLMGIVTINQEGFVEFVNSAIEGVFGYTRTELIGQAVSILMPEPYKSAHQNHVVQYLHTGISWKLGTRRELTAQRKNGETFPISILVNEYIRDGRSVFVAMILNLEHEKALQNLLQSSERAQGILEATNDLFLGTDQLWRLTYVNARAEEILGEKRENAIGKDIWEVFPELASYFFKPLAQALRSQQNVSAEGYYSERGRWFTLYGYPTPTGLTIQLIDTTVFRENERSLLRLNRALSTVNACNRALAHGQDEISLLREICMVLVNTGGFSLAWIGFAEGGRAETIRPLVYIGQECNYLNQVYFSSNNHAQTPAGHALKNGVPFVSRDLDHQIGGESWRQYAVACGFQAVAAFPLAMDNGDTGILGLCAGKTDAFDGDAFDLLYSLAAELTYGIRALRAQLEMRKLSSAMRQTADSIVITDCHGVIEYVNPAFEAMSGFRAAEAMGLTPRILQSGMHDPKFYSHMWKTILGGEVFCDVFINRSKQGNLFYAEQTITPLKDPQGIITHFVATCKDISERIEFQDRLRYLSHYDLLTELPNRALLLDRLNHAIAQTQRNESQIALLLLDLDHFKDINDSLGHDIGDKVLKETAQRIKSVVRGVDTVARLGGDEFAILLEGMKSSTEVCDHAQRLLHEFVRPFDLDTRHLRISASMGIATCPADTMESDALLQYADTAMHRAKELGRDRFEFYVPALTARFRERVRLTTELRHALEREEFVLYYQPQVRADSQVVVGMEALLRWKHRHQELISPARFVPCLEESGLIIPVTEWILCQVCEDWQTLKEQVGYTTRISVNLSGRHLSEPGLDKTLRSIVGEWSMDTHCLELEVTESAFMSDMERAVTALSAIHDLGARTAIDDFGTGYSALSYLRRLPIDTVKIDRSFVRDISTDSTDAALVRSIIDMCCTLEKEIVAEGVEDREQFEKLRSYGCHIIQGYWFSKPLPMPEVIELLTRGGGKILK